MTTFLVVAVIVLLVLLHGRWYTWRLDKFEARMKERYGIPTFDERQKKCLQKKRCAYPDCTCMNVGGSTCGGGYDNPHTHDAERDR
jgi:hypothetical protein